MFAASREVTADGPARRREPAGRAARRGPHPALGRAGARRRPGQRRPGVDDHEHRRPYTSTKTYEDLVAGFDWSLAEARAGLSRAETRSTSAGTAATGSARSGSARSPRLIWEDFAGRGADLHLRRSAAAVEHGRALPAQLGLEPGERVCLFMDRVPELYIGLPRHPQDGRHRAAALLRLRRGVALDAPRRRRDGGHPHAEETPAEGAADPRRAFPHCVTSIVVDAAGRVACSEGEVALALDAEPRVDRFDVVRLRARDAVGAALHVRDDGQARRARSTSTTRSSRST